VDTLTLDDVMALSREAGGTCVSIYMPTHRFAPDSQEEDVRRLKNLLRSAEERLGGLGLRPHEIDSLLAPARALLEDRSFWMRSGDGLAMLMGHGSARTFQLPDPFAEQLWVGTRCYLKPLLMHLGSVRPFWLLALSQKHVRLMHGDRFGLAQVPAQGIPESLAEAMRWDDFEKSSLQFHTQTSGRGGRRPAVFHGTGETDVKDELARYFRGIDRGLRDLLRDSDEPLVLAGVDYLIPLYHEMNTYPHLAAESVTGSPENMGEVALHEKAWSIVSGIIEAELTRDASRVEELWASARTTPDPESIVPAAFQGRVEALFLNADAQWWGAYDSTTGTASIHARAEEGDEELLDLASLHTLMNGGEVHAMTAEEVPHGRDAVAVLRY
jgi:hypothetical protein